MLITRNSLRPGFRCVCVSNKIATLAAHVCQVEGSLSDKVTKPRHATVKPEHGKHVCHMALKASGHRVVVLVMVTSAHATMKHVCYDA